jgi:hypothetical protein
MALATRCSFPRRSCRSEYNKRADPGLKHLQTIVSLKRSLAEGDFASARLRNSGALRQLLVHWRHSSGLIEYPLFTHGGRVDPADGTSALDEQRQSAERPTWARNRLSGPKAEWQLSKRNFTKRTLSRSRNAGSPRSNPDLRLAILLRCRIYLCFNCRLIVAAPAAARLRPHPRQDFTDSS